VCTENGRRGSHRVTEARREEETGWLVSNKWLTITTTPSPLFSKVLIPNGFKFFRKNTFKSVDFKRLMARGSLEKSNCCEPEGNEEAGAGEDRSKVGGAEFTRNDSIIYMFCQLLL
jgi:hypothetical protein